MLEMSTPQLIVAMWECGSLIHRYDFLQHRPKISLCFFLIFNIVGNLQLCTHTPSVGQEQGVCDICRLSPEYSEIIGIKRARNSRKLIGGDLRKLGFKLG